jgi:hypothetical protein
MRRKQDAQLALPRSRSPGRLYVLVQAEEVFRIVAALGAWCSPGVDVEICHVLSTSLRAVLRAVDAGRIQRVRTGMTGCRSRLRATVL